MLKTIYKTNYKIILKQPDVFAGAIYILTKDPTFKLCFSTSSLDNEVSPYCK